MNRYGWVPVVWMAVATSGCGAPVQLDPGAADLPPKPLALVGVAIVDPAGDPVERADQTVVVAAGKIAAVGPRSTTAIPDGALRVDGRGKYLIPGLWDAHVHLMNTGVSALPVFLANGVTSVREMGGHLDSTRAWQTRMRAGSLVGPRLVAPGGMLESPRYLAGVRERSARLGGLLAPRVLPYRTGIADPMAARRAIDSLKALAVDFVKIRTVASPEAFFAILREAHRAGLKVALHAPGVVPIAVAADSGLDDLEHALGVSDSASRVALAARFAARGTWYTPTLAVTRAVGIPGDSADRLIFGPEATRRNPERGYLSAWLLGWWRMQVDERLADTSTSTMARNVRAFNNSLDDVRAFASARVRILAGTDAGSVLVYPGVSLHDELGYLVRAGLTPRQALWSATVGPAQFLGLDATLGAIAEGHIADLVLLDANPLTSIENTRRVRMAVQGGRLYDRARLDAMLARVRESNRLGR